MRSHYENFPVASLFIPREKRPYVAAVYAFARIADDFADEGDDSPAERLGKLDDWQRKLVACYEGRADHPAFVAIGETARRTGIPMSLLADLLTAFRMDVTTKRFRKAADVLQYCVYSANPVGRLVLHIFGGVSERSFALSDSVCTGLQLANFAQDVSVDWRKGRLYIPLEDLQAIGYTEAEIASGTFDRRFQDLMKIQVARARNFLMAGSPLAREGPREIRFELALTVRGGLAILKRVEGIDYDVLRQRPAIPLMEKVRIVAMALAAGNAWN